MLKTTLNSLNIDQNKLGSQESAQGATEALREAQNQKVALTEFSRCVCHSFE